MVCFYSQHKKKKTTERASPFALYHRRDCSQYFDWVREKQHK